MTSQSRMEPGTSGRWLNGPAGDRNDGYGVQGPFGEMQEETWLLRNRVALWDLLS